MPVEQLAELRKAECITGFVSLGHIEAIEADLKEHGGALQVISTQSNKCACLIVALKENLAEVNKILRSAEYEPVNLTSMSGTIAENLTRTQDQLAQTRQRLSELSQRTESLARDILKLQMLQDHYGNLLQRENTRTTAPATQHTVVLEGWVRRKDYARLEQTVSRFDAASISQVTPEKDEEVPVEIENRNTVRPFEVITRLYGMPQYGEVDPTLFLAPFFALFFGLCLTDAGYGLIMIGALAYFIKKMQGDKKLFWLLLICSGATIVAGALTGGWFGDAIQQFVPGLNSLRQGLMWFDPFESPLTFFALALALGYIQLQFGLMVALGFNLKEKKFIAALCDQVTWLVMLNCLGVFLASKLGAMPASLGSLCGKIALVPAAMILLFSEREGTFFGRLGMGMYNLFSTIFWMGDILSYLRLMALGMVTGGLAMAINVIAGIAKDVPYGIGYVLMILVLIGGHTFNLVLNALGAFVHTLRLQYVEFFPKFFTGGGKAFEPLASRYKYIYINK
jgi:V/A-type H+-transporting ATPase subunit I